MRAASLVRELKCCSAPIACLAILQVLVALAASPARASGQPEARNRKLFDVNDATSLFGNLASDLEAGPAHAEPKNRTTKGKQDWLDILFKKKPYSEYWSAEKKWEDLFKRILAIQDSAQNSLMRSLVKNLESYADISVSDQCAADIRWIQEYKRKSSNFRWALHMADASGRPEPGLLSGSLANLGHVIQCLKVRAPAQFNNDTLDERYFDEQTRRYGERFRGKYCLASIRAVMPERPPLVSRFSQLIDPRKLSNISFTGEPLEAIKGRLKQSSVPGWLADSIDREHNRLDQVPFESELFQFLIMQRNFMYSLPRMMGVCFPSSCSEEDVQRTVQKFYEDDHQVVDIEYACEQEELSAWDWFNTPRLVVHVLLGLMFLLSFGASLARYILVDKLALKRRLPQSSPLRALIGALDMMSMDKCAGILLIKMKPATTQVDWSKPENRRSTSIDALKGLLVLLLVYSELLHLGCLPLPFMWAKWGDAMFPFFRSLATQPFLNASIWTEAFYMISAYLITAKLLENHRPSLLRKKTPRSPALGFYLIRRYVRLSVPMVAFMMLNYVWPRLSNGWVMQDQANKILAPCDAFGWTNMLMFHNYYRLNETCLWPSHVSASFFQLHILSYPILLLLLFSLRTKVDLLGLRKLLHTGLKYSGLVSVLVLALFGLVYPAYQAANQDLIVPFLIDYIDYDNYQRVIEWTVLPTHNHLTSYMVGIALAYLVVKRRAQEEERRASDAYLHMDSSFESVVASSTHELHLKPSFKATAEANNDSPRSDESFSSKEDCERRAGSWLSRLLSSTFVALVMFVALSASWFWTGLGQPMSSHQTFWYIIITKLVFNVTFAFLFHRHFATRRNSSSPWMLTRFLVPIGRMSLTAFYVSWLVIWFDLLSSMYQWFPSHYFVVEKFYEIIFMTLIIAMFVYGAFEGLVKTHDYVRCGPPTRFHAYFALDERQAEEHWHTFGGPPGEPEQEATAAQRTLIAVGQSSAGDKLPAAVAGNNLSHLAALNKGAGRLKASGKQLVEEAKSAGRRLSIADQYKLNTELRANYSFASIGLYETAGATEDIELSSGKQYQLATSSPANRDG